MTTRGKGGGGSLQPEERRKPLCAKEDDAGIMERMPYRRPSKNARARESKNTRQPD